MIGMGFTPGESLLDNSTPANVLLVILPTFFFASIAVLLPSLLGSYITGNKLGHFLFDFFLIIVPSTFTLTVYSNYVREISFLGFLFSILLICVGKIGILDSEDKKKLSRTSWNTSFITNARSTINILTIIAILAVDFKIFPREFSKTTNYGFSLMDSGVGLYIFANGVVAPETKSKRNSVQKSFKASIVLIFLGFVRLFLTRIADYDVSEIEYGVHWNFFFTLAFTKFFSSLVLNFFHIKFIYLNAIAVLFSHEILLQTGLNNLVIDGERGEDLLSANKEGICSLLGYVSIYLFSVYFGYILNRNKNSFKTILIYLLILKFLLLFSIVFQNLFNISRRLANSAYCFWVLFIGIFMTGLYYLLQITQESQFGNNNSANIFSPFLFESVNFNGLVFFLIGNLLTGLINLCLDTWSTDVEVSLLILLFYLHINCLVVCILFCKKWKIHL